MEFTHRSEFEYEHPDLAQQLEKHVTVQDSTFAYRLGGNRKHIVERILLSEFLSFGSSAFHMPTEHIDHKMKVKGQKSLAEWKMEG